MDPINQGLYLPFSFEYHMKLTSESRKRAAFWTTENFDDRTRAEVSRMIQEDPQLAEDAFYRNLAFGTGGLRGKMGPGTNRVNGYTISMATQGLADYVNAHVHKDAKVAIAFDSRNNSSVFARKAAEVLAANGIQVFLFEELRPTPLLSYAVRRLDCDAGIVITASHNPKEYNGYKVYWNDGGQLVPPHDKGVIEKVNKIDSPSQVKSTFDPNLILPVPSHVEESYYDEMLSLLRLPIDHSAKKELSIVFTSLHGTGITMVPEALSRAGFSSTHILENQAAPDGDFPTVASPNPEESSAMKLALEEAERIGADIILGTDPDADRVGMGIRNANGELELLNGNQAAALMLHFILSTTDESLKKNGFVAKTVVTSELIRAICKEQSVKCYDTLTGFKYIAELIRNKEGQEQFIAGGEESYGYLVGDFVRDKDAVISSVMLCEMAAWAKSRAMTIYELLEEVYARYGLYREELVSLVKEGKEGAEEITAIMESYRGAQKDELAGIRIHSIADYASGKVRELLSGIEKEIGLPSSNVIQFFLSDGSKITARPSGTEPKIKYYISVKEDFLDRAEFSQAWARAGEKINALMTALGL